MVGNKKQIDREDERAGEGKVRKKGTWREFGQFRKVAETFTALLCWVSVTRCLSYSASFEGTE